MTCPKVPLQPVSQATELLPWLPLGLRIILPSIASRLGEVLSKSAATSSHAVSAAALSPSSIRHTVHFEFSISETVRKTLLLACSILAGSKILEPRNRNAKGSKGISWKTVALAAGAYWFLFRQSSSLTSAVCWASRKITSTVTS